MARECHGSVKFAWRSSWDENGLTFVRQSADYYYYIIY